MAQQSFQYYYSVSDPSQSNFTINSLAGSSGYTVSYTGSTITPGGSTAGNDGGLTSTTYSGYTPTATASLSRGRPPAVPQGIISLQIRF